MSTSPSVPDSQNVAPLDDVLSSPTPSPLSAEAVDPVTRLLEAAEGLALLRVRMRPVTRSGASGPVVSDTEICDECQRQRVLSGMAHAGSCMVGQVLEACAAVRAAGAPRLKTINDVRASLADVDCVCGAADCEYCGPVCYRGAAHNARVEDGVRFGAASARVGQASIIASPLNHNVPEPVSPEVLGTCADICGPHPEGSHPGCDMWRPEPVSPEGSAERLQRAAQSVGVIVVKDKESLASQVEAIRLIRSVIPEVAAPIAPAAVSAEVFYVIERTEGTPTALYMRDRGGSWTHDIHLAAKWNASANAEDVWRRQTSHFRESSAVIEHSWVVAAPIAPAAEEEIDALINEVAPPPLVVSETAIRQLRPLLLELIERRKAPAHDHTWTQREADFFAERNAAWAKLTAAEELIQENERLKAYLNTPETDDFFKGIEAEAAHQRFRWPSENDAGKSPADWFWLVGYLAGKCLYAAIAGDTDKALHHTISTAAALANWHRAIKGVGNMRPGIDTPIEAQPRSSNSERRVVCGRAIAVFGFPGRDVLTCDLEPGHGDGWHHDQAANRMWVADATKIFFHPSGMVETRLFGREPEFDYSAAANAEVAR